MMAATRNPKPDRGQVEPHGSQEVLDLKKGQAEYKSVIMRYNESYLVPGGPRVVGGRTHAPPRPGRRIRAERGVRSGVRAARCVST